jgi:hypothetical protein
MLNFVLADRACKASVKKEVTKLAIFPAKHIENSIYINERAIRLHTHYATLTPAASFLL